MKSIFAEMQRQNKFSFEIVINDLECGFVCASTFTCALLNRSAVEYGSYRFCRCRCCRCCCCCRRHRWLRLFRIQIRFESSIPTPSWSRWSVPRLELNERDHHEKWRFFFSTLCQRCRLGKPNMPRIENAISWTITKDKAICAQFGESKITFRSQLKS